MNSITELESIVNNLTESNKEFHKDSETLQYYLKASNEAKEYTFS